jgi:hypothetical protein
LGLHAVGTVLRADLQADEAGAPLARPSHNTR